MIVEAQTVQDAMDDVKEQLPLERVAAAAGLTLGFIDADQNIRIQTFHSTNIIQTDLLRSRKCPERIGFRLAHVEGQDIGGSFNACELDMGGRHGCVADDADSNFAAAAKSLDGGVRVTNEPTQLVFRHRPCFVEYLDVEGVHESLSVGIGMVREMRVSANSEDVERCRQYLNAPLDRFPGCGGQDQCLSVSLDCVPMRVGGKGELDESAPCLHDGAGRLSESQPGECECQ